MAGATKFIGFDFDGSRIRLSRWGGEVNVALSVEDILKLKDACYKDLPRSPPEERTHEAFHTEYNDARQEIVVAMTPSACEKLLIHLRAVDDELFTDLSECLERRLDEHKMMRNPDGEPGVSP